MELLALGDRVHPWFKATRDPILRWAKEVYMMSNFGKGHVEEVIPEDWGLFGDSEGWYIGIDMEVMEKAWARQVQRVGLAACKPPLDGDTLEGVAVSDSHRASQPLNRDRAAHEGRRLQLSQRALLLLLFLECLRQCSLDRL